MACRLGEGGKVLDFELAKALAAPTTPVDGSQSPTITSPVITPAGIILGTAACMSPEQARGLTAASRTDVWSYGVVPWEMLTGTGLFGRGTVSDTLAAVLTGEPPWGALAPTIPVPVRRLLRRCLQKDRTRRLASIADARLESDDARSTSTPDSAMGTTRAVAPTGLPWAVVTLSGAALVACATSAAAALTIGTIDLGLAMGG